MRDQMTNSEKGYNKSTNSTAQQITYHVHCPSDSQKPHILAQPSHPVLKSPSGHSLCMSCSSSCLAIRWMVGSGQIICGLSLLAADDDVYASGMLAHTVALAV